MRLILLIILFAPYILCAQSGEVYGKVIDSKTQEPLPFTNVFVNLTTMGTTTDVHGEFVLSNVSTGVVEIVFSFVGYQSAQIKLTITENARINRIIQLVPNDLQLAEVTVVATKDKLWEKQLKKFKRAFIGDARYTSSCELINPEVLDFWEDEKIFNAKASAPLEIVNGELGYRVHYYLKDFQYSESNFSIVGNTRFEELNPVNEAQALKWMKNREEAYAGSLRYFLKSIIDKKVEQDGFKIYTVKTPQHTTSFEGDLLKKVIVPYDTTGMITTGTLPNEKKIAIKGRMEIHNTNRFPSQPFFRDVPYAISWLEVRGGFLRSRKDGVLVNSTDAIVSGDMAAARIASLLPLDYKPNTKILAKASSPSRMNLLQEKVYVRTDKPYYYPGETIWLRAFMHYRVAKLADSLSKVLYVDLLDSAKVIVNSLILKIDSARAFGDFPISPQVKPGKYILRAYTQWMRNYGVEIFFYKPIPILNLHSRVVAEETENKTVGGLEIDLDKTEYHTRDKVKVILKVADENDKLLKADLSIAVIDLSQVTPIKEEPTMAENLNWKSNELDGKKIEVKFPVEYGISLAGTFQKANKKTGIAKLTIIQDKFAGLYQVYSDSKGFFLLPNLSFYDSVRFAVQTEKGNIKMKAPENPIMPDGLYNYKLKITQENALQRFSSSFEPGKEVTMLEEVEVKSKKITEGKGYQGSYGKPDWAIKGENLEKINPNLASAIEVLLPGYKLSSTEGHYILTWTRSNFIAINQNAEPALFIDNILFSSTGETVGDRLYSINTSMIDHVEISSMLNSQMGANNSYGAIWVFTKKASNDFKSLPIVKVRGFNPPHVFISPDYDQSNTIKVHNDFRSTLYWNPNLRIPQSGQSELSFFTSDLSGKYKIIVEGVDENGSPIHTEKLIVVTD